MANRPLLVFAMWAGCRNAILTGHECSMLRDQP
jgi:hypothetical protein